jgi:adenylate cyclase, class 2
MGTEIEIKLRVPDSTDLRQRLLAAGARRIGRVTETNRIFDTPDRSLLNAGCGLRVRLEQPLDTADPVRALLTFKGPRQEGELKVREELETAVADGATLAAILDRLGLHDVIRYEKRRETWAVGVCHVVLDELPQLGRFVEIEGPDAAAVAAVRAQLALSAAPVVPETYVELAARHGTPDASGCRQLRFIEP